MPRTDPTGELLLASARRLHRRLVAATGQHDITVAQSRALQIICAGSAPRLSHIAERLDIAARTATELVDGLEAQGLAERVADATDRRATCVRPTQEGRSVCATMEQTRGRETAGFLSRLSAADRAELQRILGLLDERDGEN